MPVIPYKDIDGDKDPPLELDGHPVEEFYCGDPRCDCNTGHLRVQEQQLAIDVGTGRLDFLDGMGRLQPDRARLHDALSRLVRQGDNLARIYGHYKAVQAWGGDHGYKYIDWGQLKPNEFVTWHEVFVKETVPLLPFREAAPAEGDKAQGDKAQADKPAATGPGPGSGDDADGEAGGRIAYHLGLSDSYCVDARCDCKRVIWTVSAVLPGETGMVRQLGVVDFSFRKQVPGVLQVAAGIDADQLLVLVIRLLQRFPGIIEEHAGRYDKIRQVLIPLIAQRRRAAQEKAGKGGFKDVGRNDPCPCGSGKKFKKCHGAGAAA